MELNTAILQPFFVRPRTPVLMRELARLANVSHTTARKYVLHYVQERILVAKKSTPYPVYVANLDSARFTTLKLYFTLDLMHTTGLLSFLEHTYSYAPIILFGSAAKGIDDEQSDIDVCIISRATPQVKLSTYEKKLNRPISIHHFTPQQWSSAIHKNPELVNNIINGITLSGQVEVA